MTFDLEEVGENLMEYIFLTKNIFCINEIAGVHEILTFSNFFGFLTFQTFVRFSSLCQLLRGRGGLEKFDKSFNQ